jgi:cytochrome c-type biogenesis protein CcmH
MIRATLRGGSILALLLAAWLSTMTSALAVDTQAAFADPVQQARYENITRELRCLVCQNETIADSSATLARDLRREVRRMIEEGQSDEQIRTFMIDRYGDFVLYRPRMTARNFLLWAAPALLLLAGGTVALIYIRRRAAEADVETDTDRADSGTNMS